jgi:ankyrin repeat domain-containing protein 17
MTYFRLKLNLQEGHLDLVKYLLENGALVNAQTGTGDTALTYACENGHTDVSDLLLQYNAELVSKIAVLN